MGEKVQVAAKKPEVKRDNPASHTRNANQSQSMNPSIEHVLFFQRTIGNQAVSRLMKSGALQAKLRIGHPRDVYEQEADRVANKVINMPKPMVHRQIDFKEKEKTQRKAIAEQNSPLVQKIPVEYKDEEEQMKLVIQKQPKEYEDNEELIQTEEINETQERISDGIEKQISLLKGNGRTINKTERTFFESRFGLDFSNVRLHTGSQASETAQSLNARAFTLGRDVVFGEGQYQPHTTAGKKLIAHELTHVIQQNSGVSQIKNIDIQELNVHSIGKGKYIQRNHISRYRPTYSPRHWDYTFRSDSHIIATAKRGANLGGLSRYWSWKASNYTAITRADGSRVTNPNLIRVGDQFDVFPVMPAFYRSMVGTTGTGNCANATFAYLDMCSGPGQTNRAEAFRLFEQLSAGATSYAGNVVIFSTTGNAPGSASELIHLAIYLANNYVFTKNGMGSGPYQVMPLSSVPYSGYAGRWH